MAAKKTTESAAKPQKTTAKNAAPKKPVAAKAAEVKTSEAKSPVEVKEKEKAPEVVKEKKAPEAPVKKAAPKKTKAKAAAKEEAKEIKVPEAAKEVKAPEAPVKKAAPKKTKAAAKEEAKEVKAPEAAPEVIKEEKAPEAPVKKAAPKKTKAKAAAKEEAKEIKVPEAIKEEKAPEAPVKKAAPKKTKAKAAAKEEGKEAKAPEAIKEEKAPEAPVKKAAPKKTKAKAAAKEEAKEVKAPEATIEEKAPEAPVKKAAPKKTKAKAAAKEEVKEAPAPEAAPVVEEAPAPAPLPRRSIAFIGSECHPFVKTGGLGDVMYALPRELVRLNCDVRVLLPRYSCIPWKYQEKMVYRGEFYMNLGETGRDYYVGIMEYVADGVVYDFIDNQEFFTGPKPYTNLVDDIPKYCYFGKAALAALNFLNWIPDIVHCHDWQAGLVPVYLRTLFKDTPVGHAKSIMTIHNLRFQGIYNIKTFKYWTGLPDYVFSDYVLKYGYEDANMLKGGLAYADKITTVSSTYAREIQTAEYGEGLDGLLRFHTPKLCGIVNGIDYEMWNPDTDASVGVHYTAANVIEAKKANKLALQKELGLEEDADKYVIGLISRLTDQKGLDLVNSIVNNIMDEHTQVVVLGTGDGVYEDSFRYYENTYRGRFCACIQYDESRAHRIYAGADSLLVPSRFEPCGLTQLNAMHYGTVPIVRETGGLKDTVEPYNQYENRGNGFTFDRYESGLLLDAINRSKTLYFTERDRWNEMIVRNMDKDVSWENSAKQYKALYLEITNW